MAYNLKIWEDLTSDERKAYKIFEAWKIFSIKSGIKPIYLNALPLAESKVSLTLEYDGKYPADKIREHKNWKFFTETYELYKEDALFNPYTFMRSIYNRFPKGEYIPPAKLKTKEAKKCYYQYKMDMEQLSQPSDENNRILVSISETHRSIKDRLHKQSKLTIEDLDNFFNKSIENSCFSIGILLSIHKMLSPYYLAVSRSFERAYFNMDADVQIEILDAQKYNNFRSFVKINTKIYTFIKEVFGEDIL